MLRTVTIQAVAPQTTAELGVSRPVIEELVLKVLFLSGEMSLVDLARRVCLSLGIVDEVFQFFRREQLCFVKGIVRGAHVIELTELGKERASAALAFSQYSGPAPVSLESYRRRVRAQSVQRTAIKAADVRRAFEDLILDDDLVARIGTAILSGTSVFLYGPPGTGKTTLACSIPLTYSDFVLIPHAIEVDRQIIAVYDPGVHKAFDAQLDDDWDHRWVLCQRPCVIAGGEFSSDMLDLQFNSTARFFTAPLHLKANNGVLVLDDFGRQRMRPEELLNRWMTPLDRRTDFLTLTGGKKFEIPFDVLVVFATNLDPRTLADEAFLRRIPNKINVGYATRGQFARIFAKECAQHGLFCDFDLADYAAEVIANDMRQPLSPSHAGDIVKQILWSASYEATEPMLNCATLRMACERYFLPVSRIG